MDRNCAQRMQPHTMVSNPLSGIIVCLSVCLSGRSRAFLRILFVFISSLGVQRVSMHLLLIHAK